VKVYLIAEVAQAHDGSLGQAMAYIKAAALAGASAVKFQVHLAEEESSSEDRFRTNSFPQDRSRYEYWKRVAFNESQWKTLIDYTNTLNIDFISSVFSVRAYEMMRALGQSIWKIASGEVHDPLLMETIFNTNDNIILSTGLSTWSEIESVVGRYGALKDLTILKCTSEYPTSDELLELDVISELRRKYPSLKVGFSDHSGSIYPSLAAISKGAEVIELHVAFSKSQFGPDTLASVTFEDFGELAEWKDRFFKICHSKTNMSERDQRILNSQNRLLFTKSIFYKENLKSGSVISRGDITFLKPNCEIPANRYIEFLGKIVTRDVKAGAPLKEDDFQ
jgi:N,N'-diacetyllegionaminate synthase